MGVITVIVLRRLLPLAVKRDGVGAGHVVNNLLLHEVVRSLHVTALEIILLPQKFS